MPLANAAGVYVNVPSDATAGWVLNRAVFVLPVTLKVSVCAASSAGPALIAVAHDATVCGPAFSMTVWFGPAVKLGASLTAVTVIVNDCGADVSTPPAAVPPLSCSTSVMVAMPLAFAAGV